MGTGVHEGVGRSAQDRPSRVRPAGRGPTRGRGPAPRRRPGPALERPRTTISRIACATSAAEAQLTSTSSPGRRRWSTRTSRSALEAERAAEPRRRGRCRGRARRGLGEDRAGHLLGRLAECAGRAEEGRRRSHGVAGHGPEEASPGEAHRLVGIQGRHGRVLAVRGWRRGCPGCGVRSTSLRPRWAGRCRRSGGGSVLDDEVTARSARRSRPLRKVSSTRKARPTISPWRRWTSSTVPRTVPPVARRSSTMRTFCRAGSRRGGSRRVRPVLEAYSTLTSRPQLPELPDGDQAGVELVGQRGGEDEPARPIPTVDVDRARQRTAPAWRRSRRGRRRGPSTAS